MLERPHVPDLGDKDSRHRAENWEEAEQHSSIPVAQPEVASDQGIEFALTATPVR